MVAPSGSCSSSVAEPRAAAMMPSYSVVKDAMRCKVSRRSSVSRVATSSTKSSPKQSRSPRICRRLLLHEEHRMVGRDSVYVGVRRLGADTLEEHPYFGFPAAKVRTQDVHLVGVGDLGRDERLDPSPEHELALAGNSEVLHPLRHPARGNQVAMPAMAQQVDWCLPPLAGR